jgi:hypothetical protein
VTGTTFGIPISAAIEEIAENVDPAAGLRALAGVITGSPSM